MRNKCKICNKRQVAINYRKNDQVFYRSKCDYCSKQKTIAKPYWEQVGYKKKNSCDKCGFKSKYSEIFNVFYVDGDYKNCNFLNLKTVCANCHCILQKYNLPWKQGDLKPDF